MDIIETLKQQKNLISKIEALYIFSDPRYVIVKRGKIVSCKNLVNVLKKKNNKKI